MICLLSDVSNQLQILGEKYGPVTRAVLPQHIAGIQASETLVT